MRNKNKYSCIPRIIVARIEPFSQFNIIYKVYSKQANRIDQLNIGTTGYINVTLIK